MTELKMARKEFDQALSLAKEARPLAIELGEARQIAHVLKQLGRINLKTNTPFRDQKGVTRSKTYTWVINITNGQTDIINPTGVFKNVKYAVIEATPYDDYERFWYHSDGREKNRLRLKALFVNKLYEHDKEHTSHHNLVKYEAKGNSYIVWWRDDDIADNHPLVTGIYDPYLAGEYDDFMKGGFQDDMREDMEFFYEDERWSRD